MDRTETFQWLYSFDKYGSKYGLERITSLTEKLGNPHQDLRVIHVTGTNGKGSVCKYIASILQHAGYTVGVYLSPHLQRFSERIILNTTEISDGEVAALVTQIKPIVDEMSEKGEKPTFFEIVTAIAFLYFYNKHVDFAVVEVGLGGRLDATNVVSPMVSVITNISLEHTDILGDNIKAIASEKAGIIKPNIPIISAAKHTAREVIETVATEKNSPISFIENTQWKRIRTDLASQEFIIHGRFKDYPIRTPLLGEFQGENIALAVAVIERLQMLGVYVSDSNIIEGISTVFYPGRIEIISKEPLILLDGAHNPNGIDMLRKTLTTDFTFEKLILVVGILHDKNFTQMLSTIVPIADIVICTKSTNTRACDPTILQKTIQDLGFHKQVFLEMTIPEAVDHAKTIAQQHDLICITGSLYTVGEARNYLFLQQKKETEYC